MNLPGISWDDWEESGAESVGDIGETTGESLELNLSGILGGWLEGVWG